MADQLFELRRRRFDTPHFQGIEFIEVEAKTIINKLSGNFLPFSHTINPYRGCSHGCIGCFARVTHTYFDLNADDDWSTKIYVKVNAPEKLRVELASKRWKGDSIAMGTSTDPYQRAEGRYRLMTGILQALVDFRNPFSILTRSPLILRDLGLLLDASKVADVRTAFSVPTLNEEVWRSTEPGTPHPRKRIEAMRVLNEAGIPCGAMIAPVMPGVSDDARDLKEAVSAVVDAGATSVTPILLHLRPVVREHFMGWLQERHPELVTRYEELYADGSYGPKHERNALGQRVRGLVAASGGLKRPPESHRGRPKHTGPSSAPHQLRLL